MDVATPTNELHERLMELGWRVKKIDFKQGQYIAQGENESTGQEYDARGQTPDMATAALLQYANRSNEVRQRAFAKTARWSRGWHDKKDELAQAYRKLPPFDEKAVAAWKALAAESKIQADEIRKQIGVDVTDDPHPYESADEMRDDVHNNQKLQVSRAGAHGHPVWSPEDVVNFRTVRDALGHGQSHGDWSWAGVNDAAQHHMPLVSPLAREALLAETVGKRAYQDVYPGHDVPHKVGFMSEFLHPVQANEGEHVWVPHGTMPVPSNDHNLQTVQPVAPAAGPGNWVTPVMNRLPGVMEGYAKPVKSIPKGILSMQNPEKYPANGEVSKLHTENSFWKTILSKSVSPGLEYDPNHFWEPSQQAPPVDPSADPGSDYIDVVGATNNAAKLNTEWETKEKSVMDQAIMNAFRVAILSPRKHIRWNAAHYQALMHTDPSTKAVDLWHKLEEERERHNQGLGYEEGSHLAYRKELDYLAHQIQAEEPELSLAEAMARAKNVVFSQTKKFEKQFAAEFPEKSELRRYNMARRAVADWLKENWSPQRGWQPGQQSLMQVANIGDDINVCLNCGKSDGRTQAGGIFCQDCLEDNPQLKLPQPPIEHTEHTGADEWSPTPVSDATGFSNEDAKYGAFMGNHLDAIAQVGQHIDDIREAALKDIEEDGGRGYVFRNAVMNMNLPGVNPKVASFAWLLLRPLTSELGIIDTHIARGIRRDPNAITPKDYYKYERMQRAAKDATGYSHVPLGVYHWGLWDAIRNPGEHSDHSPLRVLDPLPWDSPDAKWDAATSAKSEAPGEWVGPPAFERGRGAMEQTAADFDQEFAGSPAAQVPQSRTVAMVRPKR